MCSMLKNVTIFFAVMIVGVCANAQYISLHQYSQSIADASGKAVSNTGFHNQYSPTGTTGCVMGIASLRSECRDVSGGLSFVLPGNQFISQFKVYVPAGTTSFIFGGYLPQSVQVAVAVHMNRAPDRVNGLSPAEYASGALSTSSFNAYDRLLAGQDVIFTADGGGTISLGGNNNFSQPLPTGAWLYVKLINGSYVYAPQALYEIDLPTYIAGYNSTKWGTDGDPVSSGTVAPPTPLTSITFSSPASLTMGTTNTITMIPNTGASLGNCSAAPSNPSNLSNLVSFSGTSILATPSMTASVTRQETVQITCGGVAASTLVTINPSPSTLPAASLTGISLSAPSFVEGSAGSISITPLPSATATSADAKLPTTCTVVPKAGGATPSNIKINQATASTNYAEISSTVGSQADPVPLTVSCGGFDADLFLLPSLKKSVDADGDLTITYYFTPEKVDVSTPGKVWIFAIVPQNVPFVLEELLVFNINATDKKLTWKTLSFPVALDGEKFSAPSPLGPYQKMTVKMGLPEFDLKEWYKIQLYQAYWPEGAPSFKGISKIWPLS